MSVHYAIRPAHPAAHLFHVVCRIERPEPLGQLFMLPAWIPGSYMVREFARHIVRISAVAGSRKVALTKLDKHTWRAAPVILFRRSDSQRRSSPGSQTPP